MPRPSSPKRTSQHPDPWSSRGIQRRYYPTADGKPLLARNSKDRDDRIKIEFLAAYYQLNRCYANLLLIRSKRGADRPRLERSNRAALQKVEKALRFRDQLEDQYAPYGVIAEPVLENGFAVDVKFSFGSVQSKAQRNGLVFFSSASVSIPLPPGVKPEDVTFPGKEELLRRLKSRPGADQSNP